MSDDSFVENDSEYDESKSDQSINSDEDFSANEDDSNFNEDDVQQELNQEVNELNDDISEDDNDKKKKKVQKKNSNKQSQEQNTTNKKRKKNVEQDDDGDNDLDSNQKEEKTQDSKSKSLSSQKKKQPQQPKQIKEKTQKKPKDEEKTPKKTPQAKNKQTNEDKKDKKQKDKSQQNTSEKNQQNRKKVKQSNDDGDDQQQNKSVEKKVSQRSIKQEIQRSILEDPVEYFYKKYQKDDLIEGETEIQKLIDEVISQNSFEKNHQEQLQQIIKNRKFFAPQAHIDDLNRIIQNHFTNIISKQNDKNMIDLMFTFLNATKNEIYTPQPIIQEAYFFPSKENELIVANLLKKATKTLDIAVFAFTNDILRLAIQHAFNKGVKVRIITDDECSKFKGADIYELAAMGIECTMDDNKIFHMHHKFAIIDQYVLLTGSFNWTSQAVNGNQENLMLIENKQLIKLYQQEYEKLWIQFAQNKLDKNESIKKIQAQKEQDKAYYEQLKIKNQLKKQQQKQEE